MPVTLPCGAITFDGHDLTGRFYASKLSRPMAARKAKTEENPAGGSILRSVSTQPAKVSFDLYAFGTSEERRESLRLLASWLAVDGPRRLSFADDGGLYCMAVPDGGGSGSEDAMATGARLSFTIPEPVMYGPLREVEFSGTAHTFDLGGTAPARPRVVCASAVSDISTGLWGFRFGPSGSGGYLRVPIPPGSHAVSIDSEARTCVVDGLPAPVTIDSDWWEPTPGANSPRVDLGSGTVHVEYRERWII